MMLLGWSFIFRHLWRHRQINILVFMVMVFSATLSAAIPTYATAIAVRNLKTILEYAPIAERNIALLSSRAYRPTAAIRGDLIKPINDIVLSTIDIQKSTLAAKEAYALQGGIQVKDLTLYTITRIRDNINLLEGKYPQHWIPRTQTDHLGPPQLEAMVSKDASSTIGLQVGDVISSTSGIIFTVSGIFEPKNMYDDIWYDDFSMFQVGIRALNINVDVAVVPLIIPRQSMSDYIPYYEAETRIIIDHTKITVTTIDIVEAVLSEVQNVANRSGLYLTTGLDNLILQYRDNIAYARITLVLLTLQSTIFTLYVIMMMTNVLIELSQMDLSTMVSRGASRFQMTEMYALEYMIVGLPVIVISPLLSKMGLHLLLKDANQVVPERISEGVWLLTILMVFLSWITITLTAYAGSKKDYLFVQSSRSRPELQTRWQKYYLDIVLLLFSGLLYWQLHQSDGFIRNTISSSSIIDPLLLIAPTLLLAACALFLMRLLPIFLLQLGKLAQYTRNFAAPVSFTRLSRSSSVPSRIIIIISLVVGLSLFSVLFRTSLDQRQSEAARYTVGADCVVKITPGQYEHVLGEPGIINASQVFRSVVRSYTLGGIDLLAVDSSTFAQVAYYPEGISSLTIEGMMPALIDEVDNDDNTQNQTVIPAIFSYSALTGNLPIGSMISLPLSGTDLTFEIRGIIKNFPTVNGAFIIVDRSVLFSNLKLDRLTHLGSHEVWIAADSISINGLLASLQQQYKVIDSITKRLKLMQSDTLLQSALMAFQINVVSLIVLSFTAYILVNYITMQQRVYEFEVLRAVGMSVGQMMTLHILEAAIVILFSLILGTGIGYGLVYIMISQLSPVFTTALSGLPISRIVVDWRFLFPPMILLCSGYFMSELIMVGLHWRQNKQSTLRISDE